MSSRKIKISIIACLLIIPAVIGFAQEFKAFFFTNFSTGEISRKLDTRVDFEKTANGVRTLQNMNVFPQGGAFRRPGTYYVSGVSDHNKNIRLIPFVYSTEESYVIEFGDYYARFYKDDGQIYTPDSYTKLLLHCNGTDGSTSFPDTSWNGRTRPTITANGDVQVFTANYKFPSGSAGFDGNGDYLLVPDSSDYQSGSTGFAYDFWVYFSSVTGIHPLWTSAISGNSNYVSFYYDGTFHALRLDNMIGGLMSSLNLHEGWAWTPAVDTWYHVALIRGWGSNANSWNAAVDGTGIGAVSDSSAVNHISGASYYVGGTTTTWTPDFGMYGHALNFHGGAGVTNAQYKFGTGSMYFDGTGDYLSTHDHTAWDFSGSTSNTYTVELFARHTVTTGTQTYVSQYQNANNYWTLNLVANSGVTFSLFSSGATVAQIATSSTTPTAGQWDHILLVRTGVTYGVYVNGVQTGYTTSSAIATIAGPLYIGSLGAANYFNGCLDYVRIVNSNPYTAAPNVGLTNTITVPSAPAVSYTQYLYLNFDNPFFNGFMDEIRYSSTTRWTSNFSVETDEYPVGDTNAGSVYQISTPFAYPDVADLKYAQNENTLYVAHRDYPPWKLTRTSHDNWSGSTVSFTSNILVSGSSGYPGCVEFHEQRLMWAGSYNYPQTIWMSQSGQYENLTSGATDSAAIIVTLSASSVNAIRWMNSSKSLIVGTTGGEWIVGPTSSSESLTPSNIQAKRHVTPGTSDVQGLKIGPDTIDIQYSGRKVRELSYSYEIEGYKSAELSLLVDHLFNGYTVTQMAYQGEPFNILWCLRSDGVLLGLTYLKDNNVYAWSRLITDGTIENIAVIPKDTGDDELWMQVKRLVSGSYKRYIEYMVDLETDTVSDMFYVDSGLSYSGSATLTLSGATHLAGCSVAVLGNSSYMGLKTVSSGGTIVLTSSVTTAHIGLPYTSVLETIDIPSQVLDKKRVIKIIPSFYKTSYFEYGSNSANAVPYVFKSGVTPYTGYLEMPIPGGWGLEKVVYFKSSNPLSWAINGLQINME